MLIVDSLIISGVRWVLNKLAEAVEAEMYDESHLRDELLAAQMKLELGEITDEEFGEIEEGVLAGLREIAERKRADTEAAREAQQEAVSEGQGKYAVESVSADLEHHEKPDED